MIPVQMNTCTTHSSDYLASTCASSIVNTTESNVSQVALNILEQNASSLAPPQETDVPRVCPTNLFLQDKFAFEKIIQKLIAMSITSRLHHPTACLKEEIEELKLLFNEFKVLIKNRPLPCPHYVFTQAF